MFCIYLCNDAFNVDTEEPPSDADGNAETRSGKSQRE
jgi:hypothetical protein